MKMFKQFFTVFMLGSVLLSGGVTIQANGALDEGSDRSCYAGCRRIKAKKVITDTLCVKNDAKVCG